MSLQDKKYIKYTRILGNSKWNLIGALCRGVCGGGGAMLAFKKQALVQGYLLLPPQSLVAPVSIRPFSPITMLQLG